MSSSSETSKQLAPSAERIIVGQSHGCDAEREHFERYRWAAPLVRGLEVIDVACGTGYGSAALIDAGAKSVRAYDISPEAIEFAREHYRRPGLEFAVADATRLPVADASADCVVSFETIEHIQEDRKYLDEMHRVLRPGGMYLISTPDRRVASTLYPLRGRPNNNFHVREYTRDELLALLRTRFDVESVGGQAFVSGALAFWPLQVGLKAFCYGLRGVGAYRVIRRVYHLGSGLEVQTRSHGVPRHWVLQCRRRGGD